MIIVRIWEGLGNQLFQYAYARALQCRTDGKVLLDTSHINRWELSGISRNDDKKDLYDSRIYGLNHFNITLQEADGETLSRWAFLERKNGLQRLQFAACRHSLLPYRFLTDEPHTFTFQKELLSVKRDSYISGHFFHAAYYNEVEAVLRRELVPSETIVLPDELKELLQTRNTVSVHIRRGDYMNISGFLGTAYYTRALAYIKSRVENPVFLFFSDDINWVKNHIGAGEERFFVSGGGLTDYEELFIMSRCRHNIIANSTFSFWGGWLNANTGRIVVSPPNLKPAMPKDWIII